MNEEKVRLSAVNLYPSTFKLSLVPQRHHWVHLRRPPRRNVACQRAPRRLSNNATPTNVSGIGCADTKQQGCEEPRQCESANQPHSNARRHQHQALSDHQLHHIAARALPAPFAGRTLWCAAPPNRKSLHRFRSAARINATPENRVNKVVRKRGRDCAAYHHIVHGANLGERERRVKFAYFVADGVDQARRIAGSAEGDIHLADARKPVPAAD